MPHRDPETGKFVSSASHGGCWEGLEIINFDVTHRIDAADLAGGNSNSTWEGSTAVVDFGDILDEFEVGEVVEANLRSTLSMPTTATAESFGRAVWELKSEPTLTTFISNALAGADETENTIDAKIGSNHDNEVIARSALHATADLNDTTNGTGAGAHISEDRQELNYRNRFGGGPVFDEDDELYLPVVLQTDNVSDHRILLETTGLLAVQEWESDSCPVMGRRR